MRPNFCRGISSLALLLGMASQLHAELKLHRLFSDDGILQRDAKVAVWGTTDKPDPVTVKFADQTIAVTPEEGKWKAVLAPLAASATGSNLVISQGDQTVTRKNVIVGDVWICGGQSNMQWAVNQCDGKDQAIAASKNPQLRLFTVERRGDAANRQSDLTAGEWAEASPTTVPDFTAVGYYFGRDLQAKLGVPIGLISSNLGATAAERWISKEALANTKELQGMTNVQGMNDLYNTMIAPLAPFGIKGAIWYQGETNTDRPYHYRHVLATMIEDWRKTFGQGNFPFLMVELAPFTHISPEPIDQEWAVLRESQQWVASRLPNVETVSIFDLGHETNIHPPMKQPVAERLSNAARALAYGEKIIPTGPKYESVSFKGNRAFIKLKNIGKGLVTKGGEVKGFTVAGEDKKFQFAQAKIKGNMIIVESDKVAMPKAVRFGWANYPIMDLWNKDGLAASPFRTDDWPVIRQDLK